MTLRELRELALDLERAGIEALALQGSSDVEAITAAAALSPLTNLLLMPVISTADERLASIVAKRATTFALLAPGRTALIFRAAERAEMPKVHESLEAARALAADGPVDYSGPTLRIRAAFNEPRPDAAARLALGAWIEDDAPEIYAAADLVVMPAGTLPAAPLPSEVTFATALSLADLEVGDLPDGSFVLDAGDASAQSLRELVDRLR